MSKEIIGLFMFSLILLLGCNYTKQNNDTTLKKGEIYLGIKTCDEANKIALEEIEEDKLKYIFGDIANSRGLPENLKSRFGIEIITIDGVVGEINECYNTTMYKEIQNKFGDDVFRKSMH